MYKEGNKILAIDPDFCDWNLPKEDLEKIVDLKAVVLQTTSFSWIDSDFLATRDIPVVNLRGFSTNAVAEWAFMMALNIARKIPVVLKDDWKQDFSKHQGIELKGKVAGIIGLGNIGTRIAEICEGFGMNVIYWSRNSRDERYSYSEIKEIMSTADVIFPAVAQNSSTESLISDEMLNSMKEGSIFVSIVHKIYNDSLLYELVEKGKIYGYANEEIDQKIPEAKGNVWTGLQLAWCTTESMQNNAQQWVDQIINAINERYSNKIN